MITSQHFTHLKAQQRIRFNAIPDGRDEPVHPILLRDGHGTGQSHSTKHNESPHRAEGS